MNKNLRLILAGIITTLISLYMMSFLYFGLIRKKDPLDQQSSLSETLFNTKTYPKDLAWFSEDQLILLEDQKPYFYSIKTRQTKAIRGISNITQVWTKDDLILFLNETPDETSIIQIDPEVKITDVLELPKSSSSFIAYPYVCSYQNTIIDNPSEVATEIQIYDLSLDTTPLRELETSLSLQPVYCNKDMLYLIPIGPIQPKLYSWNVSSDSPVEAEKLHLNDISAFNSINQSYIGIETPENGYYTYEFETEKLTRIDPNSLCTISSNELLICLKNNGDKTTIQLFTDISNTKPDKSFELDDRSFTKVIPSPEAKSFALISAKGELWILKTE